MKKFYFFFFPVFLIVGIVVCIFLKETANSSFTCSITASCCSASTSCDDGKSCLCSSICESGKSICSCICVSTVPDLGPIGIPGNSWLPFGLEMTTSISGNGTCCTNFATYLERLTQWGCVLEGEVGDLAVGTGSWSDDWEDIVSSVASANNFNVSFDTSEHIITFYV
ncbi:MAG: hypothetical protein A2161_19160 [Candidatus Schekmanbacteria bacterium RBG_13_48_7]|uniref:Uncharacterized protein n=1 Tax=Candidatus Schekmanbacteria bacterium RBG_13_48_7 TaxID=1817878 RepID=A0A1F7RRJ9_9BACT|nr:MAG: hypothetical protein A2161_19160 [Candidatus Schekmanbacteria bacterium RBG_13_48_7]